MDMVVRSFEAEIYFIRPIFFIFFLFFWKQITKTGFVFFTVDHINKLHMTVVFKTEEALQSY